MRTTSCVNSNSSFDILLALLDISCANQLAPATEHSHFVSKFYSHFILVFLLH